jgi:carbon monoxide dehydrogenase subunit G
VRIQNSVTVNRPQDEVFAALTDAPTTVRWASATKEAWWVTPPPHGVGSVRRATGVIMGQPYENEATVTEHDPPRREVLTGNQSGVKFQVVIECSPDATSQGTRVTVTSELALTGSLRFLGGVIGGQYRQMWDADMAAFKRMLEAGEL